MVILIQSKDTTDSRPRGANNNSSSRGGGGGVRGGADRYAGRGGAAQFNSSGMCGGWLLLFLNYVN